MSYYNGFDSGTYVPVCKCGGEDCFSRSRRVMEVERLTLTEDGYAEVSDTDLHVQEDWVFTCEECGNESGDLDDLLAEIPTCEDCGDVLIDGETDVCLACKENVSEPHGLAPMVRA